MHASSLPMSSSASFRSFEKLFFPATSRATSNESPLTWCARPPEFQAAILADVNSRRGALHAGISGTGALAGLRHRLWSP